MNVLLLHTRAVHGLALAFHARLVLGARSDITGRLSSLVRVASRRRRISALVARREAGRARRRVCALRTKVRERRLAGSRVVRARRTAGCAGTAAFLKVGRTEDRRGVRQPGDDELEWAFTLSVDVGDTPRPRKDEDFGSARRGG
jgi:hypothetical protein